MENFAILEVDSCSIAHCERPAGANGNSPDMDPSLLAVWRLGTHHVACLKPANGLDAHATAPHKPVRRKLRATVIALSGRLDFERRNRLRALRPRVDQKVTDVGEQSGRIRCKTPHVIAVDPIVIAAARSYGA
jgi:hypothetical protein